MSIVYFFWPNYDVCKIIAGRSILSIYFTFTSRTDYENVLQFGDFS